MGQHIAPKLWRQQVYQHDMYFYQLTDIITNHYLLISFQTQKQSFVVETFESQNI